jgi:hypothetical protein
MPDSLRAHILGHSAQSSFVNTGPGEDRSPCSPSTRTVWARSLPKIVDQVNKEPEQFVEPEHTV